MPFVESVARQLFAQNVDAFVQGSAAVDRRERYGSCVADCKVNVCLRGVLEGKATYGHFCEGDVAVILNLEGKMDGVLQWERLRGEIAEVVYPAGLRPPIACEEPECMRVFSDHH